MPTDSAIEVPPLPAGMDGFCVRTPDGTETYAVSVSDAARLAKVSQATIHKWILAGSVAICGIQNEKMVLVNSLWAALPDRVKR